MGGKLTATSQVGKGTQFELNLLLKVVSRPTTAIPKDATSPVSAQFLKNHILIAEDNPINQKLTSYMLEKLGLIVTVVEDGKLAYDAIRDSDISLVLMDCQMPVWDGLMATRAIRNWEQENGKERLPIVALTANAMSGFGLVCTEAGMDDYLIKPLDESTLVECLKKWLPENHLKLEAPPSSQPSQGAIDMIRIRRTCGDDPARVREMLELFISSTEELLDKLIDAQQHGDATQIGRMAHQIKGASAYLGAQDMTQLASAIETASRQSDLVTTDKLIQDLEAEFIGVRNEIVENLSGQDR
jgi:CheY-like chemotaxis protein/HPt (histidine-containing phosphotransfer) domain-containing protein